jgi:hypothetical protein
MLNKQPSGRPDDRRYTKVRWKKVIQLYEEHLEREGWRRICHQLTHPCGNADEWWLLCTCCRKCISRKFMFCSPGQNEVTEQFQMKTLAKQNKTHF